MIYRLLGALSVFVGAVFGLIALAVLIPFLNTFSGSLLILVAVFGILAWVFLAIGWQLLRPPKRQQRAEVEGEGRARPHGGPASAPQGADGVSGVSQPEEGHNQALGSAADQATPPDEEIDVVFGEGFATFDVVPPGVGDQALEVDEGPEYPEAAGLSIDERLAAAPTSFRKPYQAPSEVDDTGD